MISLRPYQQTAADEVRVAFRAGRRSPLVVGPTGMGKCLARGTPVLMFDGRIKPVESVIVGDDLMGPDSRPRRVLSLSRGREEMYRVTPTKGDSYVVNESHVLSLKITNMNCAVKAPNGRTYRSGDVCNLTVAEYLRGTKTFKHVAKGWRSGVDFPAHSEPLMLDPYFLGTWLGDGNSRIPRITTGDCETIEWLMGYADDIGANIRFKKNSEGSTNVTLIDRAGRGGRGGSPIPNALRAYRLILNKHIPHRFKTGSKDERLAVLAGIIDTDGSLSNGCYDLTLKSERLIDDVIFVARSLGLAACKRPARKTCVNNGKVGDYWRCCIAGDISIVPCLIPRKRAAPRKQIKDPLVTGIKVEAIGEDEYFGFEINGDRLFLLGDFTVTHNTILFSFIAQGASSKGRRVTVVAHRYELLAQISGALDKFNVPHGIISPGVTPRPNALVQVAGVQALASRMKRKTFQTDLLIIDEAHHVLLTNSWGKVYAGLGDPLLLGVTASPIRSDGKGLGKSASGLFDELIDVISVAELINEGYLVRPIVYAPTEPLDLTGLRSRAGDYEREALAERVDRPMITGDAVDHYTRLCPGMTSIAFGVNIKHCHHIAEQFRNAGYRFEVVDGSMEDGHRRAMIGGLGKGITGLVSCDLIGEGVDIPAIGCAILLRPTHSLGLHIQQIGRALRPIYADGYDLETVDGRMAALAESGKTHAFILDHVGNVGRQTDKGFVLKHGFAETPREWSLDGLPPRRRGKAKDEDEITVKQCEKCYAVFMPAPICPHCGNVQVQVDRKLKHVDGELQQVSPTGIAIAAKKARAEVRESRTLEELQRLGEERGYEPGWAKHVYEARQKQRASATDAATARAEAQAAAYSR